MQLIDLYERCYDIETHRTGKLPTELEIANHLVSAAYLNGLVTAWARD